MPDIVSNKKERFGVGKVNFFHHKQKRKKAWGKITTLVPLVYDKWEVDTVCNEKER